MGFDVGLLARFEPSEAEGLEDRAIEVNRFGLCLSHCE
jgi:hypothetical protein